jgi:signal transduction histidine kinase
MYAAQHPASEGGGHLTAAQQPVARGQVSESACGHIVQFYEDDDFLAATVADFLAPGLVLGQPAIVIATEEHQQAFVDRLHLLGIDAARSCQTGQCQMLDAHQVLSTIMIGDMPDAERFQNTVGTLVAQREREQANTSLRAYGEMVDILWKAGKPQAALSLEELWNDLARRHAFTLLCAYSMRNFSQAAHAPQFQDICRAHTHVIPTESYTRADDAQRLLEITVLQQRSRALEGEIETRKHLERQLRDALAHSLRTQEALRHSEQELKNAVTDREAALKREQYARAEAEAANRAKSQFLAVMSHELRTPLNAIGGYVQLMEMGLLGPVTEAQGSALVRVQRSQHHLLSLINDVLNFTRIEAGRVEYIFEPVLLAPMLTYVVSLVEPLLFANHLTCEFTPQQLPDIAARADREKVQQILLNLLSNAIKFTPSGGRITLDSGLTTDDPSTIYVTVRDTGVGIPESKLESVFEPFVQLGVRVAGQQEGVGLGLAISRDLARKMGGDLIAHSVVGEGTTFTLTLPRSTE